MKDDLELYAVFTEQGSSASQMKAAKVMDFISRLCDPVIVMAEGGVLATGTALEIKSNEDVIEAYLGTGLKNKKRVKK